MPSVQLPPEVIGLIIEAALPKRGRVKSADVKRTFKDLRLVSKATKQRAHHSYPQGVTKCANAVAALVLESSPASRSAELLAAREILQETRELCLESADEVGDRAQPGWSLAVKAVLAEAKMLERLELCCWGQPVELHHVGLGNLVALQGLELSANKERLHGLDFSGLVQLRALKLRAGSHAGYPDPTEPFVLTLPPNLVHLQLESLNLSADEAEHLKILLLAELESLEVTAETTQRDGSVLGMHLPELPKLRKLALGDISLRDGTPTEISRCLSLEELTLDFMKLDATTLGRLRLAAADSTLRVLNLMSVTFDDPRALNASLLGSVAVLQIESCFRCFPVRGLGENVALRSLTYAYIDVTAQGMRRLRKELARNTTLVKLEIVACEDVEEGAMKQLWLGEDSGLKELNLYENGESLDDASVRPLLKSIERHQLNVRVDVRGTGVSKKIARRFAKAARAGEAAGVLP